MRIATALTFVFAMACSDRPETTREVPTGQLPEDVTPLHYRLHLSIDPRQEMFRGTAEIELDLRAAASAVWMHGRSLEITGASAILSDGSYRELTWTQASPVGVGRLTAEEPLPAGSIRLALEYSAPFNTSLEGLYRLRAGEDFYAFTQFEATSARLAFPSFDQPGFKTPFDIKLTIPEESVAITNTPLVATEFDNQGNKTLTFATTRPLPTYLLAFAVGPFDVVDWQPVPASDLREQALPLRGITTRGKGDEIRFALENTADIVLELESYYGTAYPYAKLDIIAIPDFDSGAMENAGAIMYREQRILLREDSPVVDKHTFFSMHAHELAHQWFGNLVTPVWWDDLWLKESFGDWNGYSILDRLYPKDNYLDSLFDDSVGAMKEDGLSSARRIREPIHRHEDIAAAYDAITYSKGSGILAMFEAFLGAESFRKGIRLYIENYAWKNTSADDFITAITEANPQADEEVLQDAFRSYIEQAGVPQLSVSLDCSDDANKLDIAQQRYLPLGSEGSASQTWIIPTCVSAFAAGERSDQCFLLERQQQTVELEIERCPSAVLPNANGTGYYRFTMPGKQWRSLLAHFDALGTREQIAVAGSLGAALNSGNIALEDYLAAVQIISGSRSWRVSTAPLPDIYKLMDHGADPGEKVALQKRLKQWYRPQLEQLDSLPELSLEQQHYRMLMMSTLALHARDPKMLQQLTAMGRAFTGFDADEQLHPDAIDSNLIYIALLAGVDTLGKSFTDLLWKHFRASDNATLRERLLLAISSSIDPAVGAEARAAILSPDLGDNEISHVFWGQMGRPDNHRAMWEWTETNLDAVLERFSSGRKGRIPGFFSGFCDEGAALELEATFGPIIDDFESGPRYLAKSLESIRLCAAFIDHYGS
jgi:alanyl aminopeptidase